ncbi:MAG: hypothetical protein HXX08_23665 [Chloroflexi bacterium]|uniref:Uncharacterized protein n=1 Tax=Candidatus Chlorohelix allophototropha TaxID=3003348 RepID=A0A8T7M9R5_9CHLR|nr:hypothetical protein [Chloroflexota bacterium]WJW68801.1 hypothetical protein OZ401_004419 [Chloroflexota bacterium L227-S17]
MNYEYSIEMLNNYRIQELQKEAEQYRKASEAKKKPAKENSEYKATPQRKPLMGFLRLAR